MLTLVNIGDLVECRQYILFPDNTKHYPGQTFTVKAESLSYFNYGVNVGQYRVVGIKISQVRG